MTRIEELICTIDAMISDKKRELQKLHDVRDALMELQVLEDDRK